MGKYTLEDWSYIGTIVSAILLLPIAFMSGYIAWQSNKIIKRQLTLEEKNTLKERTPLFTIDRIEELPYDQGNYQIRHVTLRNKGLMAGRVDIFDAEAPRVSASIPDWKWVTNTEDTVLLEIKIESSNHSGNLTYRFNIVFNFNGEKYFQTLRSDPYIGAMISDPELYTKPLP